MTKGLSSSLLHRWLDHYQYSSGKAVQDLSCMFSGADPGDEFHVGVVGSFSSGKSTLINSLLGETVAETHVNPTTSKWSSYRFGSVPSVKYVNPDGKSVDEYRLPGYRQIDRWFSNGPLRDQFPNSDEQPHDVQEQVFLPHALLRAGIVLNDTPGHDSTDPRHKAVAMTALESMNGLIYMLQLDHIASGADLPVLKYWSSTGKPMCFVVSRVAHLLDSPAQLLELRKHLKNAAGRFASLANCEVFWAPDPLDDGVNIENDPYNRAKLICDEIHRWRAA